MFSSNANTTPPKLGSRLRARALLVVALAGSYNSCELYGVTGGGLGHSAIADQTVTNILVVVWLFLLIAVPLTFIAAVVAFVRSAARHEGSMAIPRQLQRAERMVAIAYVTVPAVVLVGIVIWIAGIPPPYPDVLPLVAFGPPLLGMVATIDAIRLLQAGNGPIEWGRLARSAPIRAAVACAAVVAAIWSGSLLPLGLLAVLGIVATNGPPTTWSARIASIDWGHLTRSGPIRAAVACAAVVAAIWSGTVLPLVLLAAAAAAEIFLGRGDPFEWRRLVRSRPIQGAVAFAALVAAVWSESFLPLVLLAVVFAGVLVLDRDQAGKNDRVSERRDRTAARRR